MIATTVNELCAAVGGTVLQSTDAAVTTVCTDSRGVPVGSLFIPLVGERFDGHDYLTAALSAGAAGCFCSRTPEELLSDKFYIRVDDTQLALKALASWYRGRFTLPMIQITGSVGKTTTKEMIASVLAQHYFVLKTDANYNNEIGTPQTLLGLTPAHQAAVIETGMYMANRNIATLDAGVPVLSMHAPFEVVSKLDCYMTYKGCKAVFEAE